MLQIDIGAPKTIFRMKLQLIYMDVFEKTTNEKFVVVCIVWSMYWTRVRVAQSSAASVSVCLESQTCVSKLDISI